jgi:hypothetical protein
MPSVSLASLRSARLGIADLESFTALAIACQTETASRLQACLPVKTTLIYALVGTLLGIVLASLLVPPALSWYSAPGGLPQGAQVQAIVQIPEVIRYATGKLIRWQMISAVIGGVLGIVVGVMFTRSNSTSDLRRRMSTPAPIPGR